MSASGRRWRWPAAAAAAPLLAGLAAVVFVGWRELEFLTDDAFIAFRYASNALAGHGLVWNPAPFRPVEGYTSFLWVALLTIVWRVTGVEPPQSANVIALVFGYATLGLAAAFVRRMELGPTLTRIRAPLGFLALFAVASNRTFLTWLSSGLETAMFNFLLTWWLYEALTEPRKRTPVGWPLRLGASAALVALTRPDGLLALAGTVLLLLLASGRGRDRLLGCAPLLAVATHLAWRRATYGAWLPNTYHAKAGAPWPAVGARYAACFVVEYGVWLWLLVAAVAVIAIARRRGDTQVDTRAPAASRLTHVVVALGVVLGQAGYYLLIIGGDHFEFRVLSHLIPLLYLSALYLLARARSAPRLAVLTMSALWLSAQPLPWLSHIAAKQPRAQNMLVPDLAPYLPGYLQQAARRWQGWREGLAFRYVCVRRGILGGHTQNLIELLPSRADGKRLASSSYPIIAAKTPGVLGWVLPDVAVIDELGLNDAVIARTPPSRPEAARLMAHDREPPPGYIACFEPNVTIQGRRALVTLRAAPMTAARIRRCESWSRRQD